MSRLIASILLSILLFPLASLVYLVVLIVILDTHFFNRVFSRNEDVGFIVAGSVAGLFVAGYWLLLWRHSVKWTPSRIQLTLGAAFVAIVGGFLFAFAFRAILRGIEGEFPTFLATSATPLLWLVATVLIWRETPAERAERARAANTIICPTCGYNLTGLTTTRCPECGSQFTLDQLLASQPGTDAKQLDPSS